MNKLSQLRNINFPLNPLTNPSAFNPDKPVVQGGPMQQYKHKTTSAIPKQYTQIPTGVPQTTKNELVNTILGAVVPQAAGAAGINVKPSVPLGTMSPIQAGEAATYIAPAYAQHMKNQQSRSAALTSQAITNTIDEGTIKRINPNWDKNKAQKSLEQLLSGPAGAMVLSQLPKNSPVGVMMNPDNQLFSLKPYMTKNIMPKKAQIQENPRNVTMDTTEYGGTIKNMKRTEPLPVAGTPIRKDNKIPPIPGKPIDLTKQSFSELSEGFKGYMSPGMSPFRAAELHGVLKARGTPTDLQRAAIAHPYLAPVLGGLVGSVGGVAGAVGANTDRIAGAGIGAGIGTLAALVMQQYAINKEMRKLEVEDPETYLRLKNKILPPEDRVIKPVMPIKKALVTPAGLETFVIPKAKPRLSLPYRVGALPAKEHPLINLFNKLKLVDDVRPNAEALERAAIGKISPNDKTANRALESLHLKKQAAKPKLSLENFVPGAAREKALQDYIAKNPVLREDKIRPKMLDPLPINSPVSRQVQLAKKMSDLELERQNAYLRQVIASRNK